LLARLVRGPESQGRFGTDGDGDYGAGLSPDGAEEAHRAAAI